MLLHIKVFIVFITPNGPKNGFIVNFFQFELQYSFIYNIYII